MSLFSRLGFKLSKPSVVATVPDEIKKENDAMVQKRKALYHNDAIETGVMYAGFIGKEVIEHLMAQHDFACVMWGSRKFARLLNLSRNILDVEIIKEDATLLESDREPVLKLLMWMSLLYVLPIKRYLIEDSVEDRLTTEFRNLLVPTKLSEMEFPLVMEGVFNGNVTEPGNPVLDIFFDALKFEEVKYNPPVSPELMRTELGRNNVFKVKAHKDCEHNLSPDWLNVFQEELELETFVNISKAKEDNEYMHDDGIT